MANGSNAWSEGACTYTYALVAHNHATQGSSSVPAYPPASHFSPYNNNSSNPSSPANSMSFNFMDFSGISVGGGMVDSSGETKQTQQQMEEMKKRVDEVDGRGYTRLHYAAALGMPEAVRDLLALGASTIVQDNAGNTPLHWAVAYNQLEVYILLYILSEF